MTLFLTTLAAILGPLPMVEAIPPSLCEAGEETIISGAVQDDFGLDISVCVIGEGSGEDDAAKTGAQRLTIRWSGEGGDDAVSCTPAECDGIAEYSRYTSAHLTILQLAWTKNGSTQRLYQTLSRADPGQPAHSTVTHSWEPSGASPGNVDSYAVRTDAESLAMTRLETVLTAKPAMVPLLSHSQRDAGKQ